MLLALQTASQAEKLEVEQALTINNNPLHSNWLEAVNWFQQTRDDLPGTGTGTTTATVRVGVVRIRGSKETCKQVSAAKNGRVQVKMQSSGELAWYAVTELAFDLEAPAVAVEGSSMYSSSDTRTDTRNNNNGDRSNMKAAQPPAVHARYFDSSTATYDRAQFGKLPQVHPRVKPMSVIDARVLFRQL